MARRWSFLVLAIATSAGCSWEKLEKPTPPDTAQLRTELDAPNGDLSGLPLEQATPILLEVVAQVDDFCGFSPFDLDQCPAGEDCSRCPFEQHLGDVLAEVAKALVGADGSVVSIPGVDGALTVQSTCRGWEKPSPDPAHGYLEASLSFSGEGLDPVVWGQAHACEELTGARARRIRYEGDFILTYEPERLVAFNQLHTLPFVLFYEGTIYDGDRDLELPIQAATRRRLDGSGAREFLVQTAFGSFVAELGMGEVIVRGAKGSFRCDVKERACALL